MGRTIRKLENSVEFSAKESKTRETERKYREKIEQDFEHLPIQDLRYLAKKKKRSIF